MASFPGLHLRGRPIPAVAAPMLTAMPTEPAASARNNRPRTNRPSLAELRAVAQPPPVVGRRNSEHWAGRYLRLGSIHLTRALLPTGVSANAVTVGMIGIGLLAPLVLLLPGWWPVLAAGLLVQLHILVDCSDGEVARWRGQTSTSGVYLDRVGHYLVEGLLPVALGVHLDGGLRSTGGWTTLGALVGLGVVWKKSFGDLVHVARGSAGIGPIGEDAEVAAPRSGGLRSLRGLLRFFPFFRAFGAIEYTLILLLLATVDAVLRLVGAEATTPGGGTFTDGGLLADQGLLRIWMVVSVPLVLATAFGYLVAILASSRLR